MITWAPKNFFRTDAELVLRRSHNPGSSHGAFVHFTDSDAAAATVGTSKTPWIALISCDSNGTNVSDENIFTRAEKLGATAAVLYSLEFQTCYIEQSLEDPSRFDRGLDIYTVSSLMTSNLIESTFSHIDAAHHGSFDPASLDADFFEIVRAEPEAQTQYLIADLMLDPVGTNGVTSPATGAGGTSSPLSGTSTSSNAASAGLGVGASPSISSAPTITSASTTTTQNSGRRLESTLSLMLPGTLCFWLALAVV
ncbi:hypothetical protein OH77DRAFT_1520055 [Trametes cingulata]|nr:hypothetical protein OH77DRAFT_1520055 [Trametes cingulata]